METLREEGWDNVTYFLSDKLEHKQGGQMSDCGKKTMSEKAENRTSGKCYWTKKIERKCNHLGGTALLTCSFLHRLSACYVPS